MLKRFCVRFLKRFCMQVVCLWRGHGPEILITKTPMWPDGVRVRVACARCDSEIC